ncbi:MAG: nucleotide sugar dehydrogenase [Magnetococcus sp. YQC-3]
MSDFHYDVCIVGVGRVGLPLALSFIDVGLSVVGIDMNPQLREKVNIGVMPFLEPGFDELIAQRKLVVHADVGMAAESRAIIITVGTPLHQHIETDLRQIQKVFEALLPNLRRGHLICLRSTVAPRTTSFYKLWLERHCPLKLGEDLFLAFCPERIAEGKARAELRSLPQIIGAEDPRSMARAKELFGHLTPELLETDFVSAELVKLFNNVNRYVRFAMSNYFACAADFFGADIHRILPLANRNYPRESIATPGLTAGTCLRKDFGMLNELMASPDMLIAAWKMNEYMPVFLVQHLSRRFSLLDRRVAVLGFSFKADTDDVRDSLVPKLVRYIQREMPKEVRMSDYHLPATFQDDNGEEMINWSTDAALDGAECVFIATNHSQYLAALRTLASTRPETWIVDLWNVAGTGLIFFQAGAMADG